MAITFRASTEPAPPALPRAGTLFLAGVPGASASTYDANLIVPGRNADAFVGSGKIAGTDGDLANFIEAIYHGGVDTQLHVIALQTTHTKTQIEAQLDKFRRITGQPTYISVAGDYVGRIEGTAGDDLADWNIAQTASPIATKLKALAAEFNCRAIVWSGQASIANDDTWIAANANSRLIGAFNDGNTEKACAGFAIQARERRVGQHGLGVGFNGSPVLGVTDLAYDVGPNDSAVLAAVNKGGVALVRDFGLVETSRAVFKTTNTDDPERFPDVAFRMDLIRQRAIRFARANIIGANEDLGVWAAQLTQDAAQLIGPAADIQEIMFGVPSTGARTSDSITFTLRVKMTAAVNTVVIETNLTI